MRITNQSVHPITINEHTGEGAEGERFHRTVTLAPGQSSEDIELHDDVEKHPVLKAMVENHELGVDLSEEDRKKFADAAQNRFTPTKPDHLLVGARESRYQGRDSGPEAPMPQPNSLRTPAATVQPGPLAHAVGGDGGRPQPPKELAEPPRQQAKPAQQQPLPPPQQAAPPPPAAPTQLPPPQAQK